MDWLRRKFRSWLYPDEVVAKGSPAILGWLQSEENNPTAVTVTAIHNGFLVMRRTYNPSGPDKIAAIHASTSEDLANIIIGQLAINKLNAR
jgi:hypothetical protein